jgi:YfdX protein
MSVSRRLQTTVSAMALATAFTLAPVSAEELTQETTAAADASISEAVQDETSAQVDERRKLLIEEATLALEKTEEALTALDDGDTQAAIDALAVATGKLETVVAREPELALAPLSTRLIQRDLLGDIDTIEAAREQIEELVDEGQLQQARPLMRDFASEIIIETTNLPLATYPGALLRATALIDDGDAEAAKQILATALSTVVLTEEQIALPVLRAERFIDAAEAALDETSPAETVEIEPAEADGFETASGDNTLTPGEFVQAAREQLNLAEALGYGTEDDFAELHGDLEQLDAKIDAEEDAGGILSTIRQSFDRFKDRFFNTES